MAATGNYSFIKGNDALANDINAKANLLYSQLRAIDTSQLDTANEYKDYFIRHHLGSRLFFSLQSSAHIIYKSVKISGKSVQEITFLDYGAGLGTLFMLAGMMNFKKVVYNDYLPEWHQPAKALCNALQIKIDAYVAGDVENVTADAAANNIQYDIAASRNVIEHIYNLDVFYSLLQQHNQKIVIYSSTTANYHNPAMRLYHIYIHKKAERTIYKPQRINEIKKLQPSLPEEQIKMLAAITRGKAKQDFIDAIKNFNPQTIPAVNKTLRTNTCDCVNGIWIEHLLTKQEHAALANNAGFQFKYSAGFWDTHYKNSVFNLLAYLFNKIITLLGEKRAVVLSPFVDIIAY